MRQERNTAKNRAEKAVRDIRRATRRRFSAEEKIRIVVDGLRGEDTIAELCRREWINQNLYYRWSKEFLEAGKKRLAGDTAREATSDEVKDLRREAAPLKEVVAELMGSIGQPLRQAPRWTCSRPCRRKPVVAAAEYSPTEVGVQVRACGTPPGDDSSYRSDVALVCR